MSPVSALPAIILAAGSSSRLGRAKQLLQFNGRTLLTHAIETARGAGFAPLITVIGHDPTGAIAQAAHAATSVIAQNPEWPKGMGTSIRAGLSALSSDVSFPGVLLMLCDQPFVTSDHLQKLLALSTPENLVAAAYNDTVGPPAIIGRKFFAELAALPDAHGAKPLLLKHHDSLLRVAIPEAARDIDTPDDLGLQI